MRVLALDTATEACSVALWIDGAVLGVCKEVGRGHAEEILPMVDAVLVDAGVRLASLDGIAACIGPGAFTGVRISVAVAQGLAFGAGLAVAPVTTLEALALQVRRAGASQILVCMDARMGEVYWGAFSADPGGGLPAARGAAAVGPASSVVLPFSGEVRGIGRGFAAYPELAALPGIVVSTAHCRALPDARDVARWGAARLMARQGIDPADLAPLYLRDKVALTEAERAASK